MYRKKYDIYEDRQGQGDVPFGEDFNLSEFNAPGQGPPAGGPPNQGQAPAGGAGGKSLGNPNQYVYNGGQGGLPIEGDLPPVEGPLDAGGGKSLGNPDDYIVDGYGGAGAQPDPSGPGTLDPGISAVEDDVGGAVEGAVSQGAAAQDAGQSPAGYLASEMVQNESNPNFRYGYWYGNPQPQTAQAVDSGPGTIFGEGGDGEKPWWETLSDQLAQYQAEEARKRQEELDRNAAEYAERQRREQQGRWNGWF